MYNPHRGMMAHPAPNSRLTELLDQIRAEFDSQVGRAGESEQVRENFIQQQLGELDRVRQQIVYLEQQHVNYKQDSERRIESLQRELENRGPPSQSQHANAPIAGPSQPAPPAIGHGPRDLFGQIMAGGGPQAQPLGPPPQEPQQPQGLPAHLTQGSGLNTGSNQQPPPPPHQGFGGYPSGANGYAPPPNQTASPGPGRNQRARPPQGPATPQQSQPAPYPGSPRGPPHRPGLMPNPPPVRDVGNNLSELELSELPPEFKKEDEEWWAIFNPKLPRRLDVNLLHTLNHTSVVCCVRFSHDGHYVATGCNRAAQIFEVESGRLVAHLEDESDERDGDLYIRSVCFSPDGKYLATGAEDKIIRVWNIQTKEIKCTFHGHEQDIYSLDFSCNGSTIASGSGDKTVRLWNLDHPQSPVNLQIEDGVTTVALSRDGRLVAAGSLDRSVRVWDTENGQRLDLLDGPDGHEDSVYSVAFSPTGRELVSGSLDKTIKMWHLSQPNNPRAPQSRAQQGRCVHTFKGHADFVLSVALTPDGNWVLSGSKDRGVCFWDPNTGHAQLYLQGHKNSVISVAPSPTGGIFATGSGDQKARIWSYNEFRA